MERLNQNNINTPDEYARIFKIRTKKGLDDQDIRRWRLLIKYFRGGKIVDLGCLDSMIPQFVKDKYPESEVWAIDFVKEVIDFYIENTNDIFYVLGDVYNTKF